MGESRNDFSLATGAAELLGRVEPIWLELRRHHAELLPRWAGLLAGSFAERQEELIANAVGGIHVVLAYRNRKDIGYCVSSILEGGVGQIDSFFVIEQERGHGVGHAIMRGTLKWFAEQSIYSIGLDVLINNDAAQRFYERYGFSARTVRMYGDAESIRGYSK